MNALEVTAIPCVISDDWKNTVRVPRCRMEPQLNEVYESGQMPPMLPMLPETKRLTGQ